MLTKNEMKKLLHDLKRISEALGLVKEERNKRKRDKMLTLLTSELDRLYEDLEEMKENGK